jgi:hypothetical protein
VAELLRGIRKGGANLSFTVHDVESDSRGRPDKLEKTTFAAFY